MKYHRIINNQIVQSWDRKQKEFYIPEIDAHVGEADWETHSIYPETNDAPALSSSQKITGRTLQVVNGKPVRVATIAEKNAEEIAVELESERAAMSLPAHIVYTLLREAGIKNAMQSAINGITDPAVKARAQDGLDRAPYFKRSDVLLNMVWSQASKPPEELDDLFRQGQAMI